MPGLSFPELAAGRNRQGVGLRGRPGGGRGGRAGRAADARRRARGCAVRRSWVPRSPRGLRARLWGRLHRLPGEGDRHRGRSRYPAPGWVLLCPLRARPGSRGAGPGVAGVSLSPGLAAMAGMAAAGGPFAKASRRRETLAGVCLAVRRAGGRASSRLHRHLRARRPSGRPGAGRGHPPRRGPRRPAHPHRRRRRLDLAPHRRRLPRGHLHRRPLPRPRAPALPPPLPGVLLGGRKDEWLTARPDDLGYGYAAQAESPAFRRGRASTLVPLTWPVHRLRRCRGRLHDRHRPAPQAGR